MSMVQDNYVRPALMNNTITNEKTPNKHDPAPYRKIKGKSTVVSSRWQEALNQPWMDYYGWSVTPISQEIWKQEKLLRVINEKFKFEKIGLLRASPFFNYNWHVDTNRGCSINMLLSHGKCNTFFAKPSSNDFSIFEGHLLLGNSQFIELNYELDTFYAFNPQQPHCVYNFEETRYLFSCEFSEPKEKLPYERLCRWLDEVEL